MTTTDQPIGRKITSWDALKADTVRLHGRFTWGHLLGGALLDDTFRALVTLRVCQSVAGSNRIVRIALPCFKLIHRLASYRARLGLQWSTEIGPGLALTHALGTRISSQVRVGKNVTLLHGVVIGQRQKVSRTGARQTLYPVIEDDVFVGPYAIIIGGVTVGRGSRIAGGAFVTKSVPPYSTVVGNPAKIVRTNCVPDVMNRAPV